MYTPSSDSHSTTHHRRLVSAWRDRKYTEYIHYILRSSMTEIETVIQLWERTRYDTRIYFPSRHADQPPMMSRGMRVRGWCIHFNHRRHTARVECSAWCSLNFSQIVISLGNEQQLYEYIKTLIRDFLDIFGLKSNFSYLINKQTNVSHLYIQVSNSLLFLSFSNITCTLRIWYRQSIQIFIRNKINSFFLLSLITDAHLSSYHCFLAVYFSSPEWFSVQAVLLNQLPSVYPEREKLLKTKRKMAAGKQVAG